MREPIFPRNVRIPTRGRNREGNFIGALFYKYLSLFESIGDRVLFPLLLSPASFSPTRSRSRPLPVFEAELPGVYLFLQIFYTFRTRICIHNGHGRPEPALSSRLYFSSHSFPCSPFIPFLFLSSCFSWWRARNFRQLCVSVCQTRNFWKAESILSHFCRSYLM